MIKITNRIKTILTVETAVNYWVFIKEKMVCYIFYIHGFIWTPNSHEGINTTFFKLEMRNTKVILPKYEISNHVIVKKEQLGSNYISQKLKPEFF